MPTLLVCEDDTDFEEYYTDKALTKLCSFLSDNSDEQWTVDVARTYGEANKKAGTIGDDDIISLDSRLGCDDIDGERILAGVRSRGCKCLAVWHSSTDVPDWARDDCRGFVPWEEEPITVKKIYEEWIKNPTIATPPPALLHPPFPEYLVTAYLLQIANERGCPVEVMPHFWENAMKEYKKYATNVSDDFTLSLEEGIGELKDLFTRIAETVG